MPSGPRMPSNSGILFYTFVLELPPQKVEKNDNPVENVIDLLYNRL